MLLRPAALALTVIAGLSGQAAYAASAKTVAISIDGHRTMVRTHGDTVGAALTAAHVLVNAHDLLLPTAGSKLSQHTTVVLRRGREIELTVDGRSRQVWVTATSVDEALDQIGLRTNGALLSADRSRGLPLKGFSLSVRTLKSVQLLDAGHVHRVNTNAVQVSELLQQSHIRLARTDTVNVKPTAAVVNGMVVRITRVRGRQVSLDVAIPFAVQRRADHAMYKGTTKVVQDGRVGVLHKTYALTYVNGHLTARRLASRSVRTASPVTEIVAYGTKARPSSVSGADGLNWGALANCESGGNPNAVNPAGYYGLYQFDTGTWRSVGGSGLPTSASAGEQTYRAKLLYKRSGRSPWPVCGRYL